MPPKVEQLEVLGKGVAKRGSGERTGATPPPPAPPFHHPPHPLPHKQSSSSVAFGATTPATSGIPSMRSLPSVRRTSSGPRQRPSTASNTDAMNASIGMSLVRNLKEQILCLESQLDVVRRQLQNISRSELQHSKHDVGTAHDAPVEDQHPHSAHSSSPPSQLPSPHSFDAKAVELPLRHHSRIHHTDAAAGLSERTESMDVNRLRSAAAPYQIERSALLHNVESLTKDIEGLQSLAVDLGRARDAKVAEAAQLRTALRRSSTAQEALSAECAAASALLDSMRGRRRSSVEPSTSLDRNVSAACGYTVSWVTSADGTPPLVVEEEETADKAREFRAREKARADTLEVALHREQDRAALMETHLCAALDRADLMERREAQLADYYQNLSARFVTVSAVLRHVLDAVPEELLARQRIPSPERTEDGSAVELTLGEVWNTLDAWQGEVETNREALLPMGEADRPASTFMMNDAAPVAPSFQVSGGGVLLPPSPPPPAAEEREGTVTAMEAAVVAQDEPEPEVQAPLIVALNRAREAEKVERVLSAPSCAATAVSEFVASSSVPAAEEKKDVLETTPPHSALAVEEAETVMEEEMAQEAKEGDEVPSPVTGPAAELAPPEPSKTASPAVTVEERASDEAAASSPSDADAQLSPLLSSEPEEPKPVDPTAEAAAESVELLVDAETVPQVTKSADTLSSPVEEKGAEPNPLPTPLPPPPPAVVPPAPVVEVPAPSIVPAFVLPIPPAGVIPVPPPPSAFIPPPPPPSVPVPPPSASIPSPPMANAPSAVSVPVSLPPSSLVPPAPPGAPVGGPPALPTLLPVAEQLVQLNERIAAEDAALAALVYRFTSTGEAS